MTTRTNKVALGTIASFLQYALFIILQIILTPLILNIGGKEVLGAFSIIMQVIGYGILLDLGFTVAVSRFLSQEYINEKITNNFSKVLSIARVFLFFVNTLFSLLIILIAANIDLIIDGSDSILNQSQQSLFLLAAWTFLKTPISLYSHALISTQNIATANIILIIGNFLRLSLSLIFIYSGLGLVGLVSAVIISEFLTFIIQWIFFKKKFPKFKFISKLKSSKLFKEIFSFGTHYWGVNLAAIFLLGSDFIIVGNIFGAAAASVYYSTKIPVFLIITFIYKISDNSSPAINELFSLKNYDSLRSAYYKIVRYSLIMALPVAIGVIAFNEAIISLWLGSEQYAGNIMTLALASILISQVLNHINAMITVASGNLKNWAIVTIVIGFISLISSFSLGTFIGLQWIAVAIAMCDIPNMIFLFRKSLTALNINSMSVIKKSVLPVIFMSLPLIFLSILMRNFIDINNLFDVIISVSILILTWIPLMFFIGLNGNERLTIRSKCLAYLS